jgi:hypothetical protein
MDAKSAKEACMIKTVVKKKVTPEEELFKLCKRKKLKDSEKELLIQNPNAKNSWGENLLHNYMKHDGYDLEFMDKLLATGHDINNINKKGYSMIYSCAEFSSCEKFNEKIIWLVKNGCPVIINKFDPILIFFNPEMFRRCKVNREFFEILCEKYQIEKDLTADKYKHINPVFQSNDIEDAIWYDQTFKVNYHAVLGKEDRFGANYRTIFTENPQVLEFILNKFKLEGETINNFPEVDQIYQMYADWNQYKNLDVLYKCGFIDNEEGKAIWQRSSNDVEKNICDCMEQYRFDKPACKRKMFLWALVNRKIKDFSLIHIKFLRLSVDDLKLFIDSEESKCYLTKEWEYRYTAKCEYFKTFIEDCPNDYPEGIAKNNEYPQGHAKINEYDIKNDLTMYTKEYCQKKYDEIQKFLSSNK